MPLSHAGVLLFVTKISSQKLPRISENLKKVKFYFLALETIHLFHLYSHWLPVIISNVLFGCCNKFGFGFIKINRKALYDEGNGVCLCFMKWKKKKVSLLIYQNP